MVGVTGGGSELVYGFGGWVAVANVEKTYSILFAIVPTMGMLIEKETPSLVVVRVRSLPEL